MTDSKRHEYAGVTLLAVMVVATSLWSRVFAANVFWIGVAILIVVGGFHIITWVFDKNIKTHDSDNKAGDGLRTAVAAGLTVVSILLPSSLFITRFGGSNKPLPPVASTDLFVTALWLLISLVFGLYTIFVAVTRGYEESPLRRKDIGICFGLQLIFLLVGVFTFVWSMYEIASELIR